MQVFTITFGSVYIFSYDLCCRALLRLVEDKRFHGAVLRVQPKGSELVELKDICTPIDVYESVPDQHKLLARY